MVRIFGGCFGELYQRAQRRREGLTGAGGAWWACYVTGTAGFVGREGELSRLGAALGGDIRLVLVVGDAGVGKSRFAGEGMRRAAAGGLVGGWGACLPLADKLPLLPVADAVGELGRVDGGRVLKAALDSCPAFVRDEVARLLPQLGPGDSDTEAHGEAWRRERLFAAMAELLGALSQRSAVGLVIDDVHWADSATLDLLTFLTRVSRGGAVTVVATCRSDEPAPEPHVEDWLAHVHGSQGVEEIRLGPLTREEAAEQVAALVGAPPSARLVEEVYARAEGNAFFTEQLVAAAHTDSADGGWWAPAGLPGRLAELLAARVSRCKGDARTVLMALSVAGRPLTEDLLNAVTGLASEEVRGGLRELARARLLAEDTPGFAHQPRHALLAEAVASQLLPGERAGLHEQIARAIEAAHDDTLAAEIAGHWAAADQPVRELPARLAAARAAERVFGFAQAAAHWQRSVELCQAQPDAAEAAGTDLPTLYVRAIDALDLSGNGVRAGVLAEEAYRGLTGHPDPSVAAVIYQRAAHFRAIEAPAAGLPLIKEALRLFERAPQSADQAEAWLDYAMNFLFHGDGRQQESRTALAKALEIAEAAGATGVMARILASAAREAFLRGQIDEGFADFRRGGALAEEAGNGAAVLIMAVNESDALLKLAQFQRAADVALSALKTARQAGLGDSWWAGLLAANTCEALLAMGRTAEAAALVEPLTSGPPDRDHWVVHEARAEIDLLRGDIEAATRRRQQIKACIAHIGSVDFARELAQRAAELALWAGLPGDALDEVQRVVRRFRTPELTILCGWLLAVGMRACADLAERARARRDEPAAGAALAEAEQLASFAEQMSGTPFGHRPLIATIPAERATWDAERTRLAGASDPAGWSAAANAWQDLGCPHRTAYAQWRHAEALLTTGQHRAAATALQAAAAAADGHAPLLASIGTLARRARIALPIRPAEPAETPAPEAPALYGLTSRELAVLRLLASGHTNAQIGEQLFISPKTASVHVTAILRKLGVASRVQAAAVAERAGLLLPDQP